MFDTALKVLREINESGHDAFIVGGAVRDKVLGLEAKDVDLATNMPINVIEETFRTFDVGRSKDHGMVIILVDGFDFEITQFRADGEYKDGRRPENIEVVSSFETDAKRRDFTINGMGINAQGEIIDFVGGKEDLAKGVLRTIGDPFKRFGEDHLRMIRAPRFASRGFTIDKRTERAIKLLAPSILKMSVERIWSEIFKAASQRGDRFATFIELMEELNLLRLVLPEVSNMRFFDHAPGHHPEGNVWDHTLAGLRVKKSKNPIVNLAILFHDIGKTETLGFNGDIPTYKRHDKKSVEMIRVIAKRLKISTKVEKALAFAAGNHMKFHNILKMRPSKIARLVANENWDVLVNVGYADEFSRGEMFMHAGEFVKIIHRAEVIRENFDIKQSKKSLKLVDGRHVLKLTGLEPGPAIGDIIEKTTNWILDNGIKNQKEIDKYILKMVSS